MAELIGAEGFDRDILFNPSPWRELIMTQNELFDPATLYDISDRLRREFHHGHMPNRKMPEIPRENWHTDLLAPY